MKNCKKILILIVCITSLQAKQTGVKAVGAAPVTPITTQPIPQPQRPQQPQIQPIVQPKRAVTFRELVATIKNSPSNVVWNNASKLLRQDFINDIISDSRAANFTQDQVEILLTIARDSHAQFTGNNAQDAQILTNINNQINNSVASL